MAKNLRSFIPEKEGAIDPDSEFTARFRYFRAVRLLIELGTVPLILVELASSFSIDLRVEITFGRTPDRLVSAIFMKFSCSAKLSESVPESGVRSETNVDIAVSDEKDAGMLPESRVSCVKRYISAVTKERLFGKVPEKGFPCALKAPTRNGRVMMPSKVPLNLFSSNRIAVSSSDDVGGTVPDMRLP